MGDGAHGHARDRVLNVPMLGGETRAARADLVNRLSVGPDFPARGDLGLEIADLHVQVASCDAGWTRRLARSFGAFRGAESRQSDTVARLCLAAPSRLWRDESPEPRVVRSAPDAIGVEHRDMVAMLALDGSRMDVLQPPRLLSTENALRVLFGLLLVRRGGLLLHAAGVVRRGAATVLFGRSGSGKSTSAQLARGRPILGDDLVALRRVGSDWLAYSTPFGGASARRWRRPRAVPVSRLYRLRHGPELEARDLPAARAIAELVQCAVLPAAAASDQALAFERCVEIQAAVPVRELFFPLDPRLWRWLDEREL